MAVMMSARRVMTHDRPHINLEIFFERVGFKRRYATRDDWGTSIRGMNSTATRQDVAMRL